MTSDLPPDPKVRVKVTCSPCVSASPEGAVLCQVSAVVSIPLWQWFLERFGKKTAAFCGITVSLVLLTSLTLTLLWHHRKPPDFLNPNPSVASP